MVWLVVVTLLIPAIVVLVWPLWRHTERPLPAGVNGMLEDAEQERNEEKKRLLANLRTLRLDYAEEKMTEEDFRDLEVEYQQQLAAILDGREHARYAPPVVARRDLHRVGSAVLLVLVAAASLLLFKYNWKFATDASPTQVPEVDAMIQRLEARLAANPDDMAGQLLMARSYAALGRNHDALKAWKKVLELEPGNTDARGNLAVILLQTGGKSEVQEALNHIAQLRQAEPAEPGWLWYQSMGEELLGQRDNAKTTLEKLLSMLPPDSEKAAMVREALTQMMPNK